MLHSVIKSRLKDAVPAQEALMGLDLPHLLGFLHIQTHVAPRSHISGRKYSGSSVHAGTGLLVL